MTWKKNEMSCSDKCKKERHKMVNKKCQQARREKAMKKKKRFNS
jgi:hypothetical protein